MPDNKESNQKYYKISKYKLFVVNRMYNITVILSIIY